MADSLTYSQITKTKRKNRDTSTKTLFHSIMLLLGNKDVLCVLMEKSTKDLDSAVSSVTNDDAISLIDSDRQFALKHSRFFSL